MDKNTETQAKNGLTFGRYYDSLYKNLCFVNNKKGGIKMEVVVEAKVTLETIEKFSEVINETMVNQCGCTDTYCGGCPGM